MKTKIRIVSGETIEVQSNRITIMLNDIKYTISENNFGQLVINKIEEEDSTIHILPSTSNEIRIV